MDSECLNVEDNPPLKCPVVADIGSLTQRRQAVVRENAGKDGVEWFLSSTAPVADLAGHAQEVVLAALSSLGGLPT
jgi:hypothetical protein